MRQWKKFCYTLLLGCMLTVFCVQPVFAAGGNDAYYTYTVKLYAGNQGTLSSAGGVWVDNSKTGSSYKVSAPQQNGSQITISGLQYGDVVGMDANASAALGNESKYYIRGIRESGHDNNTVSASAFTVESDREYVVAYGIKGDMVSYVVNYVDTSGNKLLESQTYYGAVGDKPVVAFRYVENYWPQSYNLTKTLSANASENVFTFVYYPMYEKNPDDADTDNQTDADTDENANPDADANGNADGGANADADADENGTGEEDANLNPEDIVNLDEEEVPLAARMFNQVKDYAKENTLQFVGLSVLILVGLSVLLLLLIKRRKKNQEEADEGTE